MSFLKYPKINFGTYRLGDKTFKSLEHAFSNGYNSIDTASLYKNEEFIYYIPRDNEMINCLKNFGFNLTKIEYPYINTTYQNFIFDHLKFLINIFSNKFISHAFWRSSFNIVCKK